MKSRNDMDKVGIIGLGYVGLPLAVEFGKIIETIGCDINKTRIRELINGQDRTKEVSPEELKQSTQLSYSFDPTEFKDVNYFIITVPTPVDDYRQPDLLPLINASKMVGQALKKNDIVIYESTVYPGCTEEICVPVLEQASGLKFNQDFFCGYSPERINPGDKEHRLITIKKITSGSTSEVAIKVDELYKKIIKAGTHLASSLRVAEAAKVIENSQRDINIAFVNELALIFERMDIDTHEVLEAAGTKWNFLRFKPGLVGGHCIGVDPYYLTHKAESLAYHPEVILAGRRINDGMGPHVARELIAEMARRGAPAKGARVLIMGLAFKENCPDLRNTRVVDMVRELQSFGATVDIFDPHANPEEVAREYWLILLPELKQKYHAIVLAVRHKEFVSFNWTGIRDDKTVVYDVKG